MQSLAGQRTEAGYIAAGSGLTLVAGVLVLALRSSRAELGDGHISFTPVLIGGIALLALPIANVVYKAAKRTRRLIVPAMLISVAAALVIATSTPGNMMGMLVPIVLVPVIGLIWLAEAFLRKFAERNTDLSPGVKSFRTRRWTPSARVAMRDRRRR